MGAVVGPSWSSVGPLGVAGDRLAHLGADLEVAARPVVCLQDRSVLPKARMTGQDRLAENAGIGEAMLYFDLTLEREEAPHTP
jgi:hypothetical protein